MSARTTADMVEAGLALAELGTAAAQKKIQPMQVVHAVSAVLLTVADLADLKSALDDADKARLDALSEFAAAAKLGPRP